MKKLLLLLSLIAPLAVGQMEEDEMMEEKISENQKIKFSSQTSPKAAAITA